MKPLYFISLLLALVACSENNRRNELSSTMPHQNSLPFKTFNSISLTINQIKTCKYPTEDPLFQKKENKQLVVIQVTVERLNGSKKNDIIPFDATVADQRGNEYKNSPTILAMAQNNSCISGNDLADYNSIWSGEIAVNNTSTAFAIGFELPTDAVPAKLYWNKDWLTHQQFITLTP
jgi:hypothetical protein